ncbi:hypothetical protein PG996_003935 [Apiospora saccharicola]|uniref:Uncharacterized protein n=1 Tax=Apiospora saccharicola TaxID=335842 RepID=A0ABR1W5N0_9PEZI
MSTVAVDTTLSSTTSVASQNTTSSSSSSISSSPRSTQSTIATSDITTTDTWQRRDIAYLKPQGQLEKEYQEVILGQELHSGATDHPCIIMDMAPSGKHALVTTISSFSSGSHNDYQAPWKQTWHQSKDPDRFRSFAGTERYSASRNFLLLEGGRQFPKSRTAWVYAGWVHLVPVEALKPFLVNNDAAPGKKLKLEMQSWIDLYGHQCSVTSANNDLFNDARLTSEIYLRGSLLSSPESQQSSICISPTSAPASPRSPRQQSPQQASVGTPKPRAVTLAPVNHAVYENVAGDFTKDLISQQTYQLSLVYQQQTQQSHATWAQYPQTQLQFSTQYQYQQASSVICPGQYQQLHATSYIASTGACMPNAHFSY